ncbi:NAD(P)H-binding protein [Neogemmobacter tilapiae]|uniref:Membrane protein n=1 Tax=Neogemmobacter tilapiae TaxID=875041 RepID=A0A918WI89_9RHOB|nr:NAD(P)H-binding protein [Gemmobacter tilapiae]GHC46117.1 membrane protein [Gemmobacter tilapiae]
MEKTALVLGATGGIGGEVARGLLSRDWQVRALHRQADQMQGRDGLDWHRGDAMNAGDVARAARGVALIVHAVNPPGYKNWAGTVLPMLDNTMAAARENGAQILLPGTVYNYAPQAGLVTETTPQRPISRKGAIRVSLEQRLKDSGLPVLVVRAGDYFGPKAGNTWFAQGLIKPGAPLKSVTRLAAKGVGHQWAYLPDVAETMIRLVEMGPKAGFHSYHMEGHWDADGMQMIGSIRRAMGHPLPMKAFPWWAIRLGQPFVGMFRELAEMRYLWQGALRMDNAKLRGALGEEPHTPLDQAIFTTLKSLGCLGQTDLTA